ncbi:hypothetical protein WCLP8_1760002 [uncultured Gammaproteobacteria bacterium]
MADLSQTQQRHRPNRPALAPFALVPTILILATLALSISIEGGRAAEPLPAPTAEIVTPSPLPPENPVATVTPAEPESPPSSKPKPLPVVRPGPKLVLPSPLAAPSGPRVPAWLPATSATTPPPAPTTTATDTVPPTGDDRTRATPAVPTTAANAATGRRKRWIASDAILRSAPSRRGRELDTLDRGRSIEIEGPAIDEVWFKMVKNGHTIGYVHGSLLRDTPPGNGHQR